MSSLISKGILPTGLVLVMLAAVVALAAMLGARDEASGSHGALHPVNQFAAKFLCGTLPGPASPVPIPGTTGTGILAPGVYNTAINIHNPNNVDVLIQKKAVVSVSESEPAPSQGTPGGRTRHTLQPDASMEVDCADMLALLAVTPPAASPGCTLLPPVPPPPSPPGFCKGYVVIEAATMTAVGGTIPAQLDVTDIISVKEEHNLWKDYTFKLTCLAGYPAPALQCPPVVGFQPHPIQPQIMPGYEVPINWPLPISDQCYSDITTPCQLNETDFQIRSRLGAQYVNLNTVEVRVEQVAFASDARDVSLDFEFVSPKRVTYPCWSNGPVNCP